MYKLVLLSAIAKLVMREEAAGSVGRGEATAVRRRAAPAPSPPRLGPRRRNLSPPEGGAAPPIRTNT